MGRKAKKRLSCLMCAVLLSVTCLGNTALAGIFEKTVRKIDVWDFGAVTESDTGMYSNQIQAADWNDCANVSADGKFVGGSTTFGDLTITHNANDRLYSTSDKNYGSNGMATTAFADGYTANGMYYCNGTGGEGRRNLTVENVEAGDKIVVYMGASNASTDDLCFKYMGTDGSQLDTASFTNVGKKYEFVAQYDGTYKIYTTAAGAKPIFNRVARIPAVEVTGTVDLNGTGISGYTVTFTNERTGATTKARLNGNTYTAALAAGDSYTATLSGATGYGFTNDTKVVTTVLSDALTGKSGVTLKVEAKSVYRYTGKVTGFSVDYDLNRLSVTLAAPADSLADDVVLSLDSGLGFSAVLEPDVEYTVVLNGVNDYEVVTGGTVCDNQDKQADIMVAPKAKHRVVGAFKELPADAAVTALTFTNEADGYIYTAAVTDGGYTVDLRDGAYAADAVVEGYRTTTHVVVNGSEVSKDLLFVTTAAAQPMTRVPDLYVGYPEQGALNYNTVKEAVAACKAMNPTSEAERITVHIAPGTYREQVIIETPYISFVNDSQKEVLLTWYYGIGYQYYSVDSTGYYNAENAYDQYEKAAASKWGCATYVKNTAKGFKADGITFEASFNRYITDEELEDGVEVSGGESITFNRKYGADVTSKAATERSSAMAVEADQVEFTNCSFLGSQDTLYTGNSATSLYFKNCLIEGNTDYIFGDGNCVFDACELKWYGYSTGSLGGYIAAMKPSGSTQQGYLFRNCTITANEDLTVVGGYLGRPWGAEARVTFLNTKLEDTSLITAAGWTEMSGNKPKNANFKEFNTAVTDGKAVDLSGRVAGVIDQAEAQRVDVKAYFNGWTPASYTEEAAGAAFEKAPYVTDNGDINAPYPGHTLTVGYSLGAVNDLSDASLINWYIVEDSGVSTLVKSTTSTVGRTFQIPAEAAGKHIKVTVTPQTISGTTGVALSYQVEAFVREGYENPSGGGSDIELGDGVNIFLAGDSTVKDYSANGMYMSGKAQAEGSWGEFLQTFFDASKVKVQNYANGGRSSRNFINEGSLDKIASNIGEGDYLFIQFGHNDCANGSGYLEDRYVPLGTPDANGIYPVTAGTKVPTPSSLTDKYGDSFYSYDCGGTYKWYLLQYIEAARQAGATPVLVTPVSRMYYTADGTIKPHHDSTDATTGTQVTSNDAYVAAVKQLAEEENVQLVDAFELTRKMYETAYANDPSAANGVSEYGTQVMSKGDKTHSNKLGGFLSAELIVQAVQNMDLSISPAAVMPSQIAGENPDGQQLFTVNGKNILNAYTSDSDGNYTVKSEYWTAYGQKLIDEIGQKHEELNQSVNPPEPPEEKATVWVVGDSTVSAFNDAYYYPRYGWGTQLDKYFDSSLTVRNLALSGRSSKSYTQDTEYAALLSGMQQGDYLLVGFGHNDEKAEADRYTNPNGDYQTAGSFANSLYENYIKPAKEAGVTVILCTPVVRRTATGEWSNSNLHITSASGAFEGGDYAQSIRTLGQTLGIPVVDMTSMTKELYDSLGAQETVNLHSWTSSKASSVDNTHTNIWGGTYNAYLITQEIKRQNVPGISTHILTAQAPSKSDTLKSNPEYKEPDYSGVTTESTLWSKFGIFSGSVFGNVGGAPSAANQTLETDENGNMHIAVRNNKGKIASTADGLAMYFYKVPASSNFTLTATAKINSFASNDQVSFGLMARDDMYIDTNTTEPLGDYVAAGPLKLTQAGNVWNCFARKSGVLTQGGTCANPIAAGDTVALKIESNSDGYACTFGNEQTITGGFDFKLTSIDSEYVYVGMFAARNADVTFSDIKLVVDGKTITPETPDTPDNPDNPDNPDVNKPVEITLNDSEHVVLSAKADEDVVVKDAAGKTVALDALTLVITRAASEIEREMNQAFSKNSIIIGEGVLAKYYDISLVDAAGNKVTVENGNIQILFAYPEEINITDYGFAVYHLNADGVLESMNITLTAEGIAAEVSDFSPYALVYQAKSVPMPGNPETPDTPEVPETPEAPGSPDASVQTGDFMHAAPLMMVLMGSAVLVAGIYVYDRKRRKSLHK